jgi:hypothetical protein
MIAGAARKDTALDVSLASLQQELYSIVLAPNGKPEALSEFVQLGTSLTNAVGIVYFEEVDGRLLPGPNVNVADLLQNDEHARELTALCDDVRRTLQFQVVPSSAEYGVSLLGVPVTVSIDRCEVIVAYVVLAGEPVEPFAVTLQLVASYVTLWHSHRNTLALDWESRAIAAVAELLGKIEGGSGVAAGCYFVANDLQKFLDCDQVIIGLRNRRGAGCRVVAISGMSEFDKQSKKVKAMKAALDETTARGEKTIWPTDDATRRRATLAHRKLAEQLGAEALVSAPLTTHLGETIGAWMFVGGRDDLHDEMITNLIGGASPQVASALDVVRRAEPSTVGRAFGWFFGGRSGWRTRLAVVAMVVATCVLILPMQYKIRCGCSLEPIMRRYAVAPYSGLLDHTNVETGDVVTQGQILGVMDGRELRWEMAGLVADRNRASKQRDVSIAAGDVPAAQLAQLEVQRLELKIKTLQQRERQLEIRSPLDGFVLTSNVDSVERLPVEPGNVLFEVAPLGQVKLQVAVPAAEISHMNEDRKVHLRLDALPGEVIEGTVTRIRPRSDIRDGENVFIADVILQNGDQRLRPGMDGHATVLADQHILGWILFHKAAYAAIEYFDW